MNGGAAYTDASGLHIAEAVRCRPGDKIYIDAAGMTPGLYTVSTVDSTGGVITVAEPLAAGLSGITAYLPARASDDLNVTQLSAGGAAGSLGGIYDESLNLLLGNASTTSFPFMEITVTKGDRFINETFRYGDASLPGPSSSEEYNGTTLGELAAFLENVIGINASYDAADDRPEIGHDDVVGRGGDDGIKRLRGALVEVDHRSEERRVGKECRSRWSPYQ